MRIPSELRGTAVALLDHRPGLPRRRRNVVRLRAAWARVAVRVIGSWIAASGLLLLGWSLRNHA